MKRMFLVASQSNGSTLGGAHSRGCWSVSLKEKSAPVPGTAKVIIGGVIVFVKY